MARRRRLSDEELSHNAMVDAKHALAAIFGEFSTDLALNGQAGDLDRPEMQPIVRAVGFVLGIDSPVPPPAEATEEQN